MQSSVFGTVKGAEEKMNRVNYCNYCKHANIEIDEEPCISCSFEIGNFEFSSKHSNISSAGSSADQCVFEGREYSCGKEYKCEKCKNAYDMGQAYVYEDAENRMQMILDEEKRLSYEQGKADANKDIEPMIREIHDLVYNEAYCKGIEDYAKAYEKAEVYGCDKCEHLHDEVKCWKCIEEKLKREQNEKS